MRSHFGAIVLIVVGATFLLVNHGLLPIAQFRQLLAEWWPLILIGIGLWLLFRRR
jgi:hypothetical protein